MTRRRPSRLVALTLLATLGLPAAPVAAVADPASSTAEAAAAHPPTPESPPTGRAIGPLAPPVVGRSGGGPGGCEPVADEALSGRQAIDELGTDLPAVARGHGRSAAELRSTLRRDPSLHVDPCGMLFYVDGFGHAAPDHDGDRDDAEHGDGHAHEGGGEDGTGPDGHDHAAAVPGGSGVLAADPPAPLEDTFALHSRPGSNRTIYLDFTGHTLVNTGWNSSVPNGFHLPAFSLDGDPAFSAAERAIVQAVWQHVAEDYAPFDVNVTTEDPGEPALKRTSAGDQVFGVRAVVTSLPDVTPFCLACVGMAYMGSFDALDWTTDYRTSLVFAGALAPGDVGRIAITASHEVGHNLNLDHHGDASGPYTAGQGMWTPIMGAAGWRPLSTWSTGDYLGANNSAQDDVAMIAARGAPLAPDDHGTTRQTATELVGSGDLAAEGVIGTRTDQDWFRFTASGLTTISALPAPVGPNLDIELLVTDADGAQLALEDPVSVWPFMTSPVTGLGAEVVLDLPAGTYHARVRGVGAGDPLVDGYSDYGSLGRYTLSVTTPEVAPVAPVVQISSGPSALTNQSSATIAFVADVPGVSFECRLDAGAWVPCTSPWSSTGLADGLRTASVRGRLLGLDSLVVSRSWTVDTVAPTITIAGEPAQDASTTATTTDLTLSADEPVGGFECRRSGGAWAPCGPSVTLTDLELGNQRLEVRATDAAGNTGTAARDWVVTLPPPVATITSAPAGPTAQTSATVSFVADDPTATFECRTTVLPWSPCTSPLELTGLPDGPHTLSVRATADGRTSDVVSRSWTVDTVPPTLTISGGPAEGSASAATSVTFDLAADEPVAGFECRLELGPWQACGPSVTYAGLTLGARQVDVRAADLAGNVGSASRSWTVVPPPPVVTITSGPTGPTSATSASIGFVADEVDVSFACRLDAGAWEACSSPWVLNDLADGSRTAAVRATGVGGTSTPVVRTWIVDTLAPTVSIGGTPAEGQSLTLRTASFTLTASEAGVSYACRLGTGGAWQPCTSPVSYAGLAAGSYTFQVRGTDAAGNVGPVASRSWTFTNPIVTPPPTTAPPSTPPPSGPVPTFTDVPSSSPHAVNIGKLAARGVTLGCGGSRYCPDDDVSREQMATFLTRALGLQEGSSRPPFSDVAAGSTHARSIDAMRREQITLGCGGGRFCPSTSVPRDQMASFLQRALPLEPGSASPPFPDVRAGSTHARAIDAVRRAEITLGCPGGGYCPSDTVTRAQMASFLVRALGW